MERGKIKELIIAQTPYFVVKQAWANAALVRTTGIVFQPESGSTPFSIQEPEMVMIEQLVTALGHNLETGTQNNAVTLEQIAYLLKYSASDPSILDFNPITSTFVQ